MTVIFGRNTAYERLQNETMKPNRLVSIDHDFYSMHPEEVSFKHKEVAKAIDDDEVYSEGYKYRNPRKASEKQRSQEWASYDERSKHAIGGVAKVRHGYGSKAK